MTPLGDSEFLVQTIGAIQTGMAANRLTMLEMSNRLTAIEISLGERRGERRVGVWLLCTASAALGTVMSMLLAVVARWMRVV